jgi:hypothetical protein
MGRMSRLRKRARGLTPKPIKNVLHKVGDPIGGVLHKAAGEIKHVPVVGDGISRGVNAVGNLAEGDANRSDYSRIASMYATPWTAAFGGVDVFPSKHKSNVGGATLPGAAGSNAGDFNSAVSAADQAKAEQDAAVNAWEAGRSPYYDQIRDTQYNQALGQINDDQRDVTQQNAFAQSRAGTRGGSADLGAQAKIQQHGLEAQGKAYVAADAAALKQQQIDADHAAWMKAQGYNYYAPAAKLGSFQADNLNRSSGQMAEWRGASTGAQNQMRDATAGIQGGFQGGVINAGMTQLGGSAGDKAGTSSFGQTLGQNLKGWGGQDSGGQPSPYASNDWSVGNTSGQGRGSIGLFSGD